MIERLFDRFHSNDRRPWRWLAVVLLFLSMASTGVRGTGAQDSGEVEWQQYDVAINVLTDGTMHVTETQQIAFNSSGYRNGFADIPLTKTDGITNVKVSEIEEDGTVVPFDRVNRSSLNESDTYRVSENDSTLSIDYRFPTANYETRTFVLEYDVIDGIRAYPDLDPPNEQVWWIAITGETTEAAPVRNATVTITLPEAVPLDQTQIIDADGDLGDPSDHSDDGRVFTWTASDLTNGDSLEVRLQFPPILDIQAPQWQLSDDEEREAEQRREDRQSLFNVIFLGISGFGLVAGAVGLYGFWYTRGRDPQVGLVADFLPEPPDDLPPGVAGVLLDERADERDVVATIVDLSRRGLFQIQETSGSSAKNMELIAKTSELPADEFEKALVLELFNNNFKEGEKAPVVAGSLSNPMKLRNRLYDDVVARGLFDRSPEDTRSQTKSAGVAFIVAGVIGAVFLPGVVDTGWVVLPCIVVALFGFALRFVAPYAPRKTVKGAEAAAKWRAFYRYLDDIQKYDKIEEAPEIFEKYLAYATAFGLDSQWVSKFARYNTPAPSWYGGPIVVLGDGGYDRRYRPNSGGGGTGGLFGLSDFGDGGGNNRDSGDGGGGGGLQGWSDSAAGGLQGASDSLVDMLNSAGRAFKSFGGSGHSSRGSFGSHGGSRGFSGGGSRGGGGGGGHRGFSR
jgi:hypothetical protein